VNFGFLRRLALSVLVLLSTCCIARSDFVVPGDLYSSCNPNNPGGTIEHYSSTGVYISSITVPSSYGDCVTGLTVGPDGLLYALIRRNMPPYYGLVVAIDGAGTVRETYSLGSSKYGDKIAFAKNGQFFVAGGNNLMQFTPGSATGTVIYTDNQVVDVKGLPSGNLLVLSAYDLEEITTSGAPIRSIVPSISIGDGRGVEFNPATNDIYLTMLGYTGEQFQLMKLNGTTGQVENQVSYWYGCDIVLTSDSRLIVGSSALAPGVFDTNLNQLGTLNGGLQVYVTQAPVPEPSTFALLGVGAISFLGVAWRRRKCAA